MHVQVHIHMHMHMHTLDRAARRSKQAEDRCHARSKPTSDSATMSLAGLMAGEFDDDDDDDDDDESFAEGQEEEDDDDDDEGGGDGAGAGAAPTTLTRLPLHARACAGDAESLAAALGEGAASGQVTIGKLPDGTPRTVGFDVNQPNGQGEPPLHATMLAAAEALALAAAPSDDPWVRAAAAEDDRLLSAPVAAPLASEDSPAAAIDADAAARLACMKLLLEAGAEPERKVYGRSALHLACACAALPALAPFAAKAVGLLLSHGAKMTQPDACGKTALHYAAVGLGSLELLLAHAGGAEAAALVDRSGATPLHDALRAGAPCLANAQALKAIVLHY